MNIKQNVVSPTRITHDKFHTKNKKLLPVGPYFFFFFLLLGPLTKKYLLACFRKKFPADLIWQIYTAMSANDLINFWEQTILK